MANFNKDKTIKYPKTNRDFDFSDVLKADAKMYGSTPSKKNDSTAPVVEGTPTSGEKDYNSYQYLYETGLQNVFDDYQRNIAILNEQEQEAIAEAYYIREMSKKYLGEYASNAGVGDVSGNLIDIYAAYQSNIGAINKEYDMAELALDKTYQEEKFSLLQEQQKQALIDGVAENGELAQTIAYNISIGETGGLNNFEYLKSYESQLDTATYQQMYTQLYSNLLVEISTAFESRYYGYKTDENGNSVLITDKNEYLEQYKDILSERDYQEFANMLQYSEDNAVQSYSLNTPSSENNPNPYFQPYYDPSYYYSGNDELGDNVYVIGENSNTYYVQVANDVDNDENAKYGVDNDTLFENYVKSNGEGAEPRAGEIHSYNGTYYVFDADGSWYRLISMEKTGGLQSSWDTAMNANLSNIEGKRNWKAGGFEYHNNGSGADTLTYKGMTFKENNNSSAKFHINKDYDSLTDEQKEVLDAIKKAYGTDGGMDDIGKFGVVFAAGRFWCINQMYDICPMDRV